MRQIRFKGSDSVYQIDIDPRATNKKLYHCPKCRGERKNKKAKTLCWHTDTQSGYCHHCDSWCMPYAGPSTREPAVIKTPPRIEPPAPLSFEACDKEVKRKFPVHKRRLSTAAAQWLHSRGISIETAHAVGLFSIVCGDKTEAIGFVYKYGELEVNVKFRRIHEKSFFFAIKDAPKIAYNTSGIIPGKDLIVVEGEMDTLACIEVGMPHVISPPCGAGGSQMEWIDNHETLNSISRFILATDNDEKGQALRDTLLNQWGYARCAVIEVGPYKDANELLLGNGAEALRMAINGARIHEPSNPFITDMKLARGLFLNYFKFGGMTGKDTGFVPLDNIVNWRTGALALVSGIPGHGKSGFVDFVTMLLNRKHGWKASVYSPENNPTIHHVGKLVSMMTGCQFSPHSLSEDDCMQAYDEVTDAVWFIKPELCKLDEILAAIIWLVKHRGIKVAVIDPFNVIEFGLDPRIPETEQINQVLKKLHRFAQEYDILLILVAHPRKIEVRKMNRFNIPIHRIPTLYDVMGSSHFYNHIDYGIIVYRDYDVKGEHGRLVQIIVEKIRWCELGSPSACTIAFDVSNNRYEAVGSDTTEDAEDTSWLTALPESR